MSSDEGAELVERETTRTVFRIGDTTYAGRRRRPSAIAASLRTSEIVDTSLALAGLAKPVVLVSGFWRSGTTWLQECLTESLGAKSIFEPLSPEHPLRRAALRSLFAGDEDALQAFIPGLFEHEAPEWVALDRACRGLDGGAFLLSCRRSVAEARRRAIVVKDVRLHSNLETFHRRFAVPVVHIRRHPCAVVASLITADWHWSFSRVRLGRLDPSIDASFEFDTDALSRIAAYWAHVERRASLALRGQGWGHVMSYEDFVEDPASTFAGVCDRLGLRRLHDPDFGRPAASIHPDAFSMRAGSLEPWRTILRAADVARVEDIADRVFPEWRTPPA